MTDTADPASRRELIAKLLPYLAVSAVKIGTMGSPLSLLTAASARYNEALERTEGKVKDVLPLLPSVERMRIEVVAAGTVSLVLPRDELGAFVERYMQTELGQEGAADCRSSPPSRLGEEARFDFVLRLPSRDAYAKMVNALTEDQAAILLEAARKLNPAETFVVADSGPKMDVELDPVFISENKILRGRFRALPTSDLLASLMGGRFAVTTLSAGRDETMFNLKLLG